MGLGIPSRPTYVVSHKVTDSSIPQAIISPSNTRRPTMPPSKQPPKNMAPFKARLDPSSKAALKVLLLGQDLIDVNRTEGLALLGSASEILNKRHGKPLQRGLSLAERMEETSERERGGTRRPVLEKKPEASTSSSVTDFDTETRSTTSSAMTDPSELLSSGSDEDVQSFVRKLRDFLGFTAEPEEVVFDEIDFEDGERHYAEECQAQRVATFDEQHHGHTYFCRGDIWERLGANSPYRTPEGELRKQNCDRCGRNWVGAYVWVCGVGFCGMLICKECWREYESGRAEKE